MSLARCSVRRRLHHVAAGPLVDPRRVQQKEDVKTDISTSEKTTSANIAVVRPGAEGYASG
jgi:hypothetical protein